MRNVHVDSVRWGAFDDWATVLLVLLLGLALVEGWCGAGVAGELAVSGHLLELGSDGRCDGGMVGGTEDSLELEVQQGLSSLLLWEGEALCRRVGTWVGLMGLSCR